MYGEMDSRPTGQGASGTTATLLDDDTLHDLLQRLTVLAEHTVRGSESVSITIAEDGRYRTSNSTGDTALAIDGAQYRDLDGPCLEAIRSTRQLQVVVGDGTGRWPSFEKEAAQAGVTAVLSTPLLRDEDEALGALNVYACQSAGFEDDDRRTAQLIGQYATVLVERALTLLSSTRLNEQLRQAVQTREIIGIAKGILMQTQACDRDEAFTILQRASQRENRKLRQVAEDLVERVEARRGAKTATQ